ncbi:hypothetical protein ACFL1X_01775 [Candidatus Hydrogenedentota bacterium]
MDLNHEYALANDVSILDVSGRSGRHMTDISENPFRLVQGKPARIESLKVGASQMRIVHLETETSVQGGVEGTLVFDAEGLHGSLVNNMGIDLIDAKVLFRGVTHRVQRNDTGWAVAIPKEAFQNQPATKNWMPDHYGNQKMSTAQLKENVARALFSDNPMMGSGPSEDYGPFIFGWTMEKGIDSVTMDIAMNRGLREMLVVAAIDVDGDVSRVGWRALHLTTNSHCKKPITNRNKDDYNGSASSVTISLPQWVVDSDPPEITLELKIKDASHNEIFIPDNSTEDWEKTNIPTVTQEGPITTKTYRFADWRKHYNEADGTINGFLVPATKPAEHYHIESEFSARVKSEYLVRKEGGITKWR